MTFKKKLDEATVQVNLEKTALKEVLNYCKVKEKLVLVRKFGLDGSQPVPLQRIGEEYNLTRERIRQIEMQALMRFRRLIVGNETYMKVLDEARKIIEAQGGFLLEEQLIAKMVNKGIFHFTKQEIKLILVSDFDISRLKRNKTMNRAFYLEPLFEDLLTKMALFVVDYFEKRGKSQDLYEFIQVVKDKFTQEYKDVHFLKQDIFYQNFFPAVRGVVMFDGKVGLKEFEDVYPKTVKLKLIYTLRKIGKPMHYQELPAKVLEWFPKKPVKVNTCHNELVKHNDVFVNMGLGLYALKEWGFEGGLVREILVRIFEKVWRPMSVKELCKEMLKEKMVSPNTVMLNLQKYKNLFRRVDKGVYELIPQKK